MPNGQQPFQQAPQPQAGQPSYPQPGMLYPPPVPGQIPQQPGMMYPPPQPQMPQPGMETPPQQNPFDYNVWAQQNNIDMAALGGPEGMMNAMLAAVDQAEQSKQQLQQLQAQHTSAAQPSQPQQNWRQWESMLATDASGKIIARPGQEYAVPAGVLFDANNAATERKEMLDGLLSDPSGWIQEKLGSEWVQQKIQSAVKEQIAQDKHDNGISEFVNENSEWIFEKDQYGHPTQQHTREGQRLMEIARGLSGKGIEPQHVLDLALKEFEVEMLRNRDDQLRQQQEARQHPTMQAQPGQPQEMLNPQHQPANPQQPQQQPAPTAPVGFASPNQQPQGPPNGTNFWNRNGLTDQGQPHPGAYGSQSRTVPEPTLSPDQTADAEDIFKSAATQQGLLQPEDN